MMSAKPVSAALCDTHTEKVAQGLCKTHNRLVCLSCIISKSKTQDCVIVELGNISEDQDKLLLECLLVRQKATQKKHLLDIFDVETSKLSDSLKIKINEHHDMVVARLCKMKDTCLQSLETQAREMTKETDMIRKKLDKYELQINEKIVAVTGGELLNSDDIHTELSKLKQKLDDFKDKDKPPDGDFTPTKVILAGDSLGKVTMFEQSLYEPVECPVNTSSSTGQQNVAIKTAGINNGQKSEPSGVSTRDQTEPLQEKDDTASKPSKGKQKEKEQGGLLSNLFRRKKYDEVQVSAQHTSVDDTAEQPSSSTENQCEMQTKEQINIEQFVNKTVLIEGIHQETGSPFNFSKLVAIGNGNVTMLSKDQASIVLTSIDGKTSTRKKIKGITEITVIGEDEIAIIVEEGLQFSRYKYSNGKFSIAGSKIINKKITNITGFDYDKSASKFALSSHEKVIILNKQVNVETERSYQPVDNDVITTYDFSNDCLYILNLENKTLKCFSFVKNSIVWKKKCEGRLFSPRRICMYDGKLCVSWGDAVVLFDAKCGRPLIRHDTHDILAECCALCVINDVIIFSSSSPDPNMSLKLGFIQM